MTKANKIQASDEAWDTRALGADEKYVGNNLPASGGALDDNLELQLISIRLPKNLIEDLKFIADIEGLKYQPMIRRILVRFVDCEMKKIARQMKAQVDQSRQDALSLEGLEPLRKLG